MEGHPVDQQNTVTVNADDVTSELATKIAQLSLDNAILKAQVKAASTRVLELETEIAAAQQRESSSAESQPSAPE